VPFLFLSPFSSLNDSATLANSNGAATGSVAIAVGQRPSVSVPGIQSTGVHTPLVFSSYTGSAITVADTGSDDAQLKVQLSVSEGTLTLATLNNLSFSSGANGDPSMTFSGTAAAVNAALNGASSGDASVTFYGTAANVNSALDERRKGVRTLY
jgi:hypothetical protein